MAEFGILAMLNLDVRAMEQPEIIIHHKPCGFNINTRSNKVDCGVLADYMLVHKCEAGPTIA